MYTIEEMGVISGLAVFGAGILVWCVKMQLDQRSLGKIIKKWMNTADDIEKKYTEVDKKIAVMESEYNLMCDLVMLDVKERRKDLFEHHSPLKATQAAIALIPEDIISTLKEFNGNGASNQCMLKAVYVSEKVSIERLTEAAREKGMTLLEFIAIITDVEVDHG